MVNPYAPPTAAPPKGPGAAYAVLQISLVVYALGGFVSIPFAILARDRWELVASGMTGNWPAFNLWAGDYSFVRAVGDVGFFGALIAGVVWMHVSWRSARARGKKTSVGAGAMTVSSLVPLWGLWETYGFLLELSKLNGLTGDRARVGRWWWVLVAHLVVRCVVATNHIPGWPHVGDAVLQMTVAWLGMRMISTIHRAAPRAP